MHVRMRFVILARKGIYNIDGSKSALSELYKIYVYKLIFILNVEKHQKMLSIKRLRFVILARKGILRTLMVARVRQRKQARYM